jgi:Mor family transcriptional regulator
MVVFRVETRFPYPPSVVFEYIRNLEKRMIWDGQNYESLKQVKKYEMNTQLYHVQLKKQWPLGNRDILLLF